MLTTVALAAQLLNLVSTGVSLAPGVISAAGTIKGLLESGNDPSPEVEASIRASLDASETALQSAQPGDAP